MIPQTLLGKRARMGQSIESLESRRMLSAVDWQHHNIIDESLQSFGDHRVTWEASASPSVVYPRELWISDGTEAGTQLLHDFGDDFVSLRVTYNDSLLIFVTHYDAANGDQFQLWLSDGTPQQTKLVATVPIPFTDNLTLPNAMLGDKLLFGMGDELWATNATDAGTTRIKTFDDPIRSIIGGDSAAYLAVGGPHGDIGDGTQLWKTDGTLAGTQLIDKSTGDIGPWVISQGELFFTRSYQFTGQFGFRDDRVNEVSSDGTITTLGHFDKVGALFVDSKPGAVRVLGQQPDFGPTQLVEDTKTEETVFSDIGFGIDGFPHDDVYGPIPNGSYFLTGDDPETIQPALYEFTANNQLREVFTTDFNGFGFSSLWGDRAIVGKISDDKFVTQIVNDGQIEKSFAFDTRVENVQPADSFFYFYSDIDGYPRQLFVSDGTIEGTHAVSPADPFPPPPPVGTVHGVMFIDLNGNHHFDPGEDPPSLFVYDDVNNNGVHDDDEPGADVTSFGTYQFDVSPGTHTIRRPAFSGYGGKLFETVNVAADQAVIVNFELVPVKQPPKKSTIQGFVFLDTNHDKKKQSREKGVSGFKVWLDLDQDGKRDPNEKLILTDSKGHFSFTGLKAGTYHLRIMSKSGYQRVRYKATVTVGAGKSASADFAVTAIK